MTDGPIPGDREPDPTMQSDPGRNRGYCSDCAFWDPLAGQTSLGEEVPVGVGGVCRKAAPAQMFETQAIDPRSLSEPRPAIWPMTAGFDWCGDHPLRQASARVAVDQLYSEISEKTREIVYLRENPGAKVMPKDARARKGRHR